MISVDGTILDVDAPVEAVIPAEHVVVCTAAAPARTEVRYTPCSSLAGGAKRAIEAFVADIAGVLVGAQRQVLPAVEYAGAPAIKHAGSEATLLAIAAERISEAARNIRDADLVRHIVGDQAL